MGFHQEGSGRDIRFPRRFRKFLPLRSKRKTCSLEADAFLALGEDVFRQVKDHVDDFSRIIKMNRSPDRTSLNKISKIPANTAVLIVNDTYESSIDTVNSFYEVGISHINMIPFDEELEHTGIYDRLQIAVTPGESVLVPRHIKKIIDIGYRRVSFDTMSS